MKKHLLFVLPFLLSSCSGVSKYSIYTINNYEQVINKDNSFEFIYLSSGELINMLDSKNSFPLYIYSKGCGYCEDFSKVLDKYIDKYSCLIYKYESNYESNEILLEKYEDIFKDNLFTPTFMLIDNGEMIYNFSRNKLSTYNSFKPVANNHLVKSHISTLLNCSTYLSYKDDKKDYLCLTYDSSNVEHLKSLSSLYNISKKSKSNTLIIDINNSFEDEIFNYDLTKVAVSLFENGQRKSITTFDDDASYIEFINQYYH